MANIVVTFTDAQRDPPSELIIPLEKGSVADTENIAIGASSTAGSKTAAADKRIVSILAEDECWIMIGAAPAAVAASGRKMSSGERLQFLCEVGEKVACIQV